MDPLIQYTTTSDGVGIAFWAFGSGPTPGPALDVCAGNDLAVMACGPGGVVVFNIKTGNSPVRIAQIPTPGSARRVACSGNLIAVAEDTEGLSVIDITDPPAARITQQIKFDGPARAVAAVSGVAYVGLASGKIVAVDMVTGTILDQSAPLALPVQDLGIDGDYLFVATEAGLDALTLLPLKFVSHRDLLGGEITARRLFVGNGLAYRAQFGGFSTLSITDPTKALVLSSVAPGPAPDRAHTKRAASRSIATRGRLERR